MTVEKIHSCLSARFGLSKSDQDLIDSLGDQSVTAINLDGDCVDIWVNDYVVISYLPF